MTSPAKKMGIGIEDYLNGELDAEQKHEFVDGEVYAMVGVTVLHNDITLNMAMWLRTRVEAPCKVFVNDVKVFVNTDATQCFYYPDVMVACDGPDQDLYYRQEPCLIVEVLSNTTERRDRSDKFFAYRKLPSLREYVLVAQDAYRVEVYRKGTNWDLEVYGEGDNFRLDCAADEMSVAEVYDKVQPVPDVAE